MLDAYHTKAPDLQAELEEIKRERRELEKEKVKVRDERNEYRRLIREQARRESFLDLVGRVISEETESVSISRTVDNFKQSRSATVCCVSPTFSRA